jgi:LPXTG-motif cell wall-anchored protein
MLRRLLPAIVAVSAVTLLPTGTALAHDHDITATCEGLSVEMFNYSAEPANVNTVQIWVDGSVVVPSTTFGSTFSWSTSFADSTVDHTYRVSVASTMFPEATFDTGVQSIDACAAPTTTTTTPSTTTSTTPSTTTTTTTTTLAPPTSTTTTTLLGGAGPSTSSTTTTVVAAAGGVATSTTLAAPAAASRPPAAVSPADATLPATGADENSLALAALGAILLGGFLTVVAVRSRQHD